MKLSIIILNYNTPELVYNCLDSIKQYLNIEHEVILVDNGSNDRVDPDKLKTYKNLRYILLEKNLGFGGGNNLGATEASGELLWFLNSDTLLPDASIEKLVSLTDEEEKIGVASPVLYNDIEMKEEQPDYYGRFQSLSNIILRPALVKRPAKYYHKLVCDSRHKSKRLSDGSEPEKCFAVDYVAGASLIIRKEIFDQIGGFDTNFFMYFEDADLCYRAKKLGYRVVVANEAKIIHLQGKSIKKNWTRKKYYYRSQDYFWQKHYGLLPTIAMRVLRLPLKALRYLQ